MGCFVKLQRPGFTEMMDAVESGAVKTVVTKDLSRLGRNYLQVGLFTEITFQKKGAVSYTHLDVYKRQVLASVGR